MSDRNQAQMRLRALLTAVALGVASACGAAGSDQAGEQDGHAVILLYHHVAADTPASTSVTPETFEAHLEYLQSHDYQVLPLSRIIEALTGNGDPLPPRAVAFTFDDAYDSVASEAAPRLERYGYPYTVFVSTDYIDQGYGNYLTWEELRALERRGAAIANHSRSHDHYLARRSDAESDRAWRDRVSADIRAARERLDAELRAPLTALAYPYGEFGPALTELVADLGIVAFGQQSGPAGPASDPQALPRFPMASRYADLDGLAEKLATRPLRVSVKAPADPVLTAGAAPPALRLQIDSPGALLDALSCFVSNQPSPAIRWIDREAGLVEVSAQRGLLVGRSKYTCTAPAADGSGAYYWYSHLWMVRPAGGGWYRD